MQRNKTKKWKKAKLAVFVLILLLNHDIIKRKHRQVLQVGYKTTDGLMRHLRENGIQISGSTQKRQLINSGYFHGYKGYRFFKTSSRPIPFSAFSDINLTIKYDSNLKSLFYGKLMYIETAVKNVALNRIMIDSNSENTQEMLQNVVTGYNSFPASTDEKIKKKAQVNKLRLENNIQSSIMRAYNQDNPQITHFYNNSGYRGVPLWALFEILTLGDFANLLSCLKFNVRDHITSDLGMRVVAIDTNRELIYKYLYILKDLRNAVAHNAVVFDTRFKKFDPSNAMKKCLQQYFGLQNPVTFDTVSDYVVLICYYLNLLKVSKTEIRAFSREYERISNSYVSGVDTNVAKIVVHPSWQSKVSAVKNSI